jgi:anaerobic magnesium-protoporphyrin IX monomethyl ester cyclase
MSLDVLLVRPWAPSAVPPDALVEDSLGVGYLAASLRQAGLSVAVLDAFTFYFDDKETVRAILELSPRVLGISLHSFADYRHCVAIADAVSAERPDIYRVLGGEHATFLAREIMERHRNVDAVVVGEGESTFLDLVSRTINQVAPTPVVGAMTRSLDGSILDGGARPAIPDLNALPWPDKDAVETAILAGRNVAVSLLTGRGCTHKCTFCTANSFLRLGGGVVWRRREPRKVVDELERLARQYAGRPGVHPMIQFQDVIFLGTSPNAIEWTRDFVSEMERRKLRVSFYIMARAEAILANSEMLSRLVACGLTSVEIGVETGVDRILQLYNKLNSADRTEQAIALLLENGVCYDASGFIMFDPRMTLEEVRSSALFLRKIEHATWDRYVTRLQVFPGTVIRNQLIVEGLFNANGSLDDVYAYRFSDPRVATLASHVWYYDDSLRYLDNAMRFAKAKLAEEVRTGAAPSMLLHRALELAQNVYGEYFLRLVEFAEQHILVQKFEEVVREFLVEVEIAARLLENLNVESRGDKGGSATSEPVLA